MIFKKHLIQDQPIWGHSISAFLFKGWSCSRKWICTRDVIRWSVCVWSLWGPSLSRRCQMEVDLGSDGSWGRWRGHSAVASVSLCTFSCCFCPLDLLSVHSPPPFNTTHPSTPASPEITVATLYMARAEGPWGCFLAPWQQGLPWVSPLICAVWVV